MSERASSTAVPRYVTGVGVLLGLGALLEVAVAFTALFPPDGVLPARVLTSAPFVLGLLYGGRWLARGGLPPERYARVGWWCFGGAAGFLLVNAAVMLAVPPINALILFGWVRWALSLGGAVGLLIGAFEGRAIVREVREERARVRFERSEDRRELLAFLDRLFERELIPTAADLVERADALDPAPGNAAVRAIRNDARTLYAVARHAGFLLDADPDAARLEPINLATAIDEAAATVRAESGAGDIDLDVDADGEWYVLADRLLSRALAELLDYAVGRQKGPTPRVSVSVEAGPDSVIVRITDDGSPIPPEERDGLFAYGERSADASGFDLALVGVVIEYYGGTVELRESHPDGTTFAVDLQRAAVDIPDRTGRSVGRA